MKRKIIAITGMPGSGKGEFTTVARELGFEVRSLGDTVRKYFSRGRPEKDMTLIGTFADEERGKWGDEIWARRLADEMMTERTDRTAPFLVDGLRSLVEMEHLRSRFGEDLIVIAIFSSPGTRLERLVERHRGDDPKDMAAFRERDERELRWGLGNVMALADEVLINEGTIDDLREKARTLLLKLMARSGGPLD